MNIILITVLLTVAGTCLVAYFTLLGVLSVKLMKFKKMANEKLLEHKEEFEQLENKISSNYTELLETNYKLHEESVKKSFEYYKELSERISNEVKELENNIERVNDSLVDLIQADVQSLNNSVAEVDRKIDSRVDKLADRIVSLAKEVMEMKSK